MTDTEADVWVALSQLIQARLTDLEREQLREQLPAFDQLTRLRRTAVRLAVRGHQDEVVQELTRPSKDGALAYAGVRNLPAVMWTRLGKLARTHGVDINDHAPVQEQVLTARSAATALGALNAQVPGLADALASLGRGDD